MRKTLRVSLLLLAISCPAYAGNIPNDKMPPPPPPAAAGEVTTMAAGHIGTGIVLGLLQNLLALL